MIDWIGVAATNVQRDWLRTQLPNSPEMKKLLAELIAAYEENNPSKSKEGSAMTYKKDSNNQQSQDSTQQVSDVRRGVDNAA
jgi:hypothetical protein